MELGRILRTGSRIIMDDKEGRKDMGEEKQKVRNYTGHGWEGSNYHGYRDVGEIAKDIRKELKVKFPASKFSVRIERFSGGSGLSVHLVKGPFEAFVEKPSETVSGAVSHDTYEERKKSLDYHRDNGNAQLNPYHFQEDHETYYERGGHLSARAWEIMKYVAGLVNSYRRDDSDGMIDYFDTNFYPHLEIGKWDKPFENTKEGK